MNLRELLEATDVILNENSRAKKVKGALSTGKTNHIKCFGILTAENPMGVQCSNEENRTRNRSLENTLKVGHMPYLKVKGWYGGRERSYIVYNVTRSDIEHLSDVYDQESFIWVEILNERNTGKDLLKGEFWMKSKPKGKYVLDQTVKNYAEIQSISGSDDPRDYFTQICKSMKFRLPFFTDEAEYHKVPEEFTEEEEVLFRESLDEKFTGKHRWLCRCKLYKNPKGS